jgi:hypothetical protein
LACEKTGKDSKMYGPEISAIINGYENGLTLKETADLIGTTYGKAKRIADKFELKTICGRRQSGEQRRKNSEQCRNSNFETKEARKDNDRESEAIKPKQFKNGSGGDLCVAGNSEVGHRKREKIKMLMSNEEIFGLRLLNFERAQAKAKLRPPLPININAEMEISPYKVNKKQQELGFFKRNIVMEIFDENKKLTSYDVASLTGFTTKSSGQLLNLLFREEKLTRDKFQFGPQIKQSIFVYSKP